MNSILRIVSSTLLCVAVASGTGFACALPEHSATPAAGSQEPVVGPEPDSAQEITFETKAPEKVEIPLVFAEASEKGAGGISVEERQRRALIYSVGANIVNLGMLELLLQAEVDRRSSAGLRVGAEEITDEMIDSKVREQVDAFLAQSPNGDFWRDRLIEGYTEDAFRRTIALVLRINAMFFPPDPELWPVEQLKEVFDSESDNSGWGPVAQELEGRLAMKEAGQEFPEMPSDFVFSYIMLPGVLGWLRSQGELTYPADGLPEGIALRVNGVEFKTKELLELSRGLISPVAEETAENWVGSLDLAERELRADGHWLSKETLDAMYAAERKEYDGTIFTHDQAVLDFLGFPAMEHYRQYFGARRSFRTTLPNPVPADWISAQVTGRGSFLGQGKVKAEVILVAVVDPTALEYSMAPKVYRPGSDPFSQYEATALEVAEQLRDGEAYEDLLLQYSNYPPSAPGANALDRNRGRFESLSRADLRSLLGESEYTDFLQGYSIGDDMFFEAELKAIVGPVRGPLGWYFYRISRRDPPTTEIDPVNNARHAFQVEDDLLSQRFLAYVNALRE